MAVNGRNGHSPGPPRELRQNASLGGSAPPDPPASAKNFFFCFLAVTAVNGRYRPLRPLTAVTAVKGFITLFLHGSVVFTVCIANPTKENGNFT